MKELKPLYDAAVAAEAEVNRILGVMNEHLELGTDEGKRAALELREDLAAARKEADEANELYISMRDAEASTGSAAGKFVPVSEGEAEDKPKTKMTRSEFEALNPRERMVYIRGGGKIVEDEESE